MRLGKLVEPPAKLLFELHRVVGREGRFGDFFYAPGLGHRFRAAAQNRLAHQMVACLPAMHVSRLAPRQHGLDLPQVIPVAKPGKATAADALEQAFDRGLRHILFVRNTTCRRAQSRPSQHDQSMDIPLVNPLGRHLVGGWPWSRSINREIEPWVTTTPLLRQEPRYVQDRGGQRPPNGSTGPVSLQLVHHDVLALDAMEGSRLPDAAHSTAERQSLRAHAKGPLPYKRVGRNAGRESGFRALLSQRGPRVEGLHHCAQHAGCGWQRC